MQFLEQRINKRNILRADLDQKREFSIAIVVSAFHLIILLQKLTLESRC